MKNNTQGKSDSVGSLAVGFDSHCIYSDNSTSFH